MTFAKLAYRKVVRERFTKWVFWEAKLHPQIAYIKKNRQVLAHTMQPNKTNLGWKKECLAFEDEAWEKLTTKTFKPPALRPTVKQEKNEYLPERQTRKTAKTQKLFTKAHTLKARKRNTAINDMFALRSANILSSQRQQIRKKTQRIQYLLKTSNSRKKQRAKLFTKSRHLKQDERKFVINEKFALCLAKNTIKTTTGDS